MKKWLPLVAVLLGLFLLAGWNKSKGNPFNGTPLDDQQERLLAKAIELIAGSQPLAKAGIQARSKQLGFKRIEGAIARSNDVNGMLIHNRESR